MNLKELENRKLPFDILFIFIIFSLPKRVLLNTDFMIDDSQLFHEVSRSFMSFNSKCLTEWDPVGRYYNGDIDHSSTNETCEIWADYYPNVPHSLLMSGNKCRGYSEPYIPKCFVKGILKVCKIPMCTCNSPFFCIGPTNITFEPTTFVLAQKNCVNNGALGVLKIRNFLNNDFIRKYTTGRAGIYWLGFILHYPVNKLNKSFHYEYMESVWGLHYFYRNFDPINPFEFINRDNISENTLCIVLDNRKPGDRLYWKLDFCNKKHNYICDFSSEGLENFYNDKNDDVFVDCTPPILSKWNNMYSGKHNTTRSGFPCQSWKNDYPNYIGDNIRNIALKSMEDHNYCRSLKKGFPVCMRDYPGGELEICDIPSCVNVAPFGKTYQSSTVGDHVSSLATNGIIGSSNSSCSMTKSDLEQWWEIELPDNFFIVALSLVGLNDKSSDFNNIHISIRDKSVASIFAEECTSKLWISSNEPRHFTCRRWGQTITIKLQDSITMALYLCDVEIYALESKKECYTYSNFKYGYQGRRMVPKNRNETCQPWNNVIKKYWNSNVVVYFPEGLLIKRDFELSASLIYFKYITIMSEVLQNYCRYIRINGENLRYPVCVGTGEKLIECDEIQSCDEQSSFSTCTFDSIGREYRGKTAIGKSGKECRPWTYYSSAVSRLRLQYIYPFLIKEQNYCRNPDSRSSGPWCLVNYTDAYAESCNIPRCVNMAKADVTVKANTEASNKLSWLWDDEGSDVYFNNYVTILPNSESKTNIIFKFPFPINLLYVVISPHYKENVFHDQKVDNLRNFLRLQIHTSHFSGSLTNDSSKCGEILHMINIHKVYIKCDRLTDTVEIVAAENTINLAISEIELLSSYTYSACTKSKSNRIIQVELLCKDISTFNLLRLSNPIIDKCYKWTFINPLVQKNFKRYCDIIPLRRIKESVYCGFDVCARKLSYICKTTKFGEDYQGNYSVTVSGYPCDYWKNHIKDILRFPWLVYEKNYCRNPDKSSKGLWCFIANSSKSWEFCQVPDCMNIAPYGTVQMDNVKSVENLYCLVEPEGVDYIGTMNESIKGPCKNWTSVKNWYFQESPNHNYCRNPDDKDKPWCFIHSLQLSWAYCEIPLCANFKQGDLFSGRKAIDRNTDQSYESCAVTKALETKSRGYLTWNWKAPEVVKIVGIRIYPAKTYLENFRGINIILYNSGFREAVICYMEYRAANSPFVDYPCTRKADRLTIALNVEENDVGESSTLALCEVEIFISSETRDCYNFHKGIDFMGKRSIGINGKTCDMWANQVNADQYIFPESRGSKFGVLHLVKNYCRNPTINDSNVQSKPFCYADDIIELCDVNKCTEDYFTIAMVKPINARLNKSFILTCTTSNVGFKPITIIWIRGDNIPIENSADFGITQLNGTTSELNIRFLGPALSTISCQATLGSHFASSTYTYTALPECNTCWEEIRKSCSIICGYYNPPVTLPLSKNCKMTCILETVNATVQCIEVDGILMWKPVDICVYKSMITENMINKEDRRRSKTAEPQPLKFKTFRIPDFLIFFFLLMFIFIFGMFLMAIFSESLRWLIL